MKKFLSLLQLSVLLFALPLLFSCGGDDDGGNPLIDLSDPSTFPGTYEMVELTDKTGALSGIPNLTVSSGEPVAVTDYPVAPGQTIDATVTITQTLVLTETTYTVNTTINVNATGFGNFPISVNDSGTYSLSGNQLTTTSTVDSDVEVITLSVDNNGRLVYENDDIRIVYQKQ